MAKFCGNCGNALVEGARACGNCGAFVDGSVNSYADGANQNGVPNNGNVNTNNVNNASARQSSTDIGTIGFILSIVLSIICCGYFNFIPFILCLVGLIDSKKNPNINKSLAIAGLVISCVGSSFVFLRIIFAFLKLLY